MIHVRRRGVLAAVQFTREMIETHVFDKTPLPDAIRFGRASFHPETRKLYSYSVYAVTRDRWGGPDLRTPVNEGDFVVQDPNAPGCWRIYSETDFWILYEAVPERSTW